MHTCDALEDVMVALRELIKCNYDTKSYAKVMTRVLKWHGIHVTDFA